VDPVIVIYLVLLVAAFYFLIVRPQRRQQMIRRQLIERLRVGDEIVTSGGILGVVVAIEDETLDVEIAPGTVVKLARQAVAARVTPAGDGDADGSHAGDDDTGR
jgi:preprotein translocase subunit YajC